MTKADIEGLIRQIGLKPQIAAGQNFLLDQAVVRRMITAADIQPDDTVLEIGPGFGILTEALLQTQAKIIAVELDQRLFNYAVTRFAQAKKLELVHGDVFKTKLADHVQDGKYKLVANLPYGATSLVFRNFLSLSPRPSSLTVMIQREVAKRLTAKPGEMSLLAVMAQYYGQPKYLFDVPRDSFFPQPNVDSAVIQCMVKPWPNEDVTKNFFQVVRSGFSSRRKQLRNSLAAGMHLTTAEIVKKLAASGVSETNRAQDLSVAEWLNIAKSLD